MRLARIVSWPHNYVVWTPACSISGDFSQHSVSSIPNSEIAAAIHYDSGANGPAWWWLRISRASNYIIRTAGFIGGLHVHGRSEMTKRVSPSTPVAAPWRLIEAANDLEGILDTCSCRDQRDGDIYSPHLVLGRVVPFRQARIDAGRYGAFFAGASLIAAICPDMSRRRIS